MKNNLKLNNGKISKPADLISALFSTFNWIAWRTGFVEMLIKCSQLVVPLTVQLLLKWCKYFYFYLFYF